MNDNIETRGNKFTMFSYILSCKIRSIEFIGRNIFTPVMKKARKDFDQGTVIIQTLSFTTSKDFG